VRQFPAERLDFLAPMMPTLADQPPRGDEWSTELRFDGSRCQIVIDVGDIRVLGPFGRDWASHARRIVDTARAELKVSSAIIDGALVHADQARQITLHRIEESVGARSGTLVFMAFDLLYLEGEDRRGMPLVDRRGPLHGLIRPGGRIQYSEALLGTPSDLFALVGRMKLGGIVCKRRSSVYASGISTDWV
jgi:ATP-dependent DNA ligase